MSLTTEYSRNLPKTIRVAGYDIAVQNWKHNSSRAYGCWGEFSPVEQLIKISDDSPNLPKLVDTVLHEMHHAIWWAYGIEDEDKEERTVSALGTAWMQVWRDNPALLAWLTNAVRQMNLPASDDTMSAAAFDEIPAAAIKGYRDMPLGVPTGGQAI